MIIFFKFKTNSFIKSKTFCTILLLFLFFNYSKSEEIDYQYGFSLKYHKITNIVNFGKLPNIPACCPKYPNSNANGIDFEVLYSKNLFGGIFAELRTGLFNLPANFETQEIIGNAYDENFNTIQAISLHKLSANIINFEIIPILSYQPFNLPFRLSLGFNLFFPIIANYEQKEELINPKSAFFDNNSKTRNNFSGKINSINNFINSIRFFANYDINFNKNLIISPEFGINNISNNLIKTTEWKFQSIFAGITVKYNNIYFPQPKIILPDDTLQNKISIPIKQDIIADINAFGIDEDEIERKEVKFKADEFISRKLHPLLPYIFFDKNSFELPKRYKTLTTEQADEFKISKTYFNSDDLTIYYDVLNIFGYRLRNYPDANITLIGCNSDNGLEKNNLKLSENRALEIKNYFVEVWKIPENRIKIESRNLPKKSSGNKDDLHSEENRRVEIVSSHPKINEQLFVYDTIRKIIPPKLKFYIDLNDKSDLYSWTLKINKKTNEGLKLLTVLSGDTIPNQGINFNMIGFEHFLTQNNIFNYQLELKFNSDTLIKIDKNIIVEQIFDRVKESYTINGKLINEYRLFMFDFDKLDLEEHHKSILELICENTNSESEIFINSYTDLLGQDSYNKKLSENRAKSIKQNIKCANKKIIANGNGELELFNNSTPEGRFYCRIVEVRVETPVK